MTEDLKTKLVDFEKLANTVHRIKETLEKLTLMVEEKAIAPLLEECASEGAVPAMIIKKAKKISSFIIMVSNILYKLTKINILLEKQWIPPSPSTAPSEEYILEYIRYMHKCGKLDFII